MNNKELWQKYWQAEGIRYEDLSEQQKTMLDNWQKYWQSEGIRYLAENNRIPTIEERCHHAFSSALALTSDELSKITCIWENGKYKCAKSLTTKEDEG